MPTLLRLKSIAQKDHTLSSSRCAVCRAVPMLCPDCAHVLLLFAVRVESHLKTRMSITLGIKMVISTKNFAHVHRDMIFTMILTMNTQKCEGLSRLCLLCLRGLSKKKRMCTKTNETPPDQCEAEDEDNFQDKGEDQDTIKVKMKVKRKMKRKRKRKRTRKNKMKIKINIKDTGRGGRNKCESNVDEDTGHGKGEAIQAVEEQSRTIRADCQMRFGSSETFGADKPIWAWLLRHAGWQISGYKPRGNGMTAYKQAYGEHYTHEVVPFAEIVLVRDPKPDTSWSARRKT